MSAAISTPRVAETVPPVGERSSYSATNGATSLFDVQYTRDALGRIATKTETVNGTATTYAYTYDLSGRLTEVTKDGLVVSSYVYDSNGNRISHTTPTGVVNGFYDLQDRLTKYGATTYTYTANGELATKTDASGTTLFTYDFYGNLTKVVKPDGTVIEYVIDGDDSRVGKKVNNILVKEWLYKDWLSPVAELDSAGNIISRFGYGVDGNIPSYVIKGGVTYRIVSDHLGSPRLIVDSQTGEVVQQYNYDEFGNETLFTDPHGLGRLPFGYAGGIFDVDIGLVRFGYRDYDPVIGRWTSKDPIGFYSNSENFYTYVDGEPINWIDTNGESVVLPLPFCVAYPLACIIPLIPPTICAICPSCCGIDPPDNLCPFPDWPDSQMMGMALMMEWGIRRTIHSGGRNIKNLKTLIKRKVLKIDSLTNLGKRM